MSRLEKLNKQQKMDKEITFLAEKVLDPNFRTPGLANHTALVPVTSSTAVQPVAVEESKEVVVSVAQTAAVQPYVQPETRILSFSSEARLTDDQQDECRKSLHVLQTHLQNGELGKAQEILGPSLFALRKQYSEQAYELAFKRIKIDHELGIKTKVTEMVRLFSFKLRYEKILSRAQTELKSRLENALKDIAIEKNKIQDQLEVKPSAKNTKATEKAALVKHDTSAKHAAIHQESASLRERFAKLEKKEQELRKKIKAFGDFEVVYKKTFSNLTDTQESLIQFFKIMNQNPDIKKVLDGYYERLTLLGATEIGYFMDREKRAAFKILLRDILVPGKIADPENKELMQKAPVQSNALIKIKESDNPVITPKNLNKVFGILEEFHQQVEETSNIAERLFKWYLEHELLGDVARVHWLLHTDCRVMYYDKYSSVQRELQQLCKAYVSNEKKISKQHKQISLYLKSFELQEEFLKKAASEYLDGTDHQKKQWQAVFDLLTTHGFSVLGKEFDAFYREGKGWSLIRTQLKNMVTTQTPAAEKVRLLLLKYSNTQSNGKRAERLTDVHALAKVLQEVVDSTTELVEKAEPKNAKDELFLLAEIKEQVNRYKKDRDSKFFAFLRSSDLFDPLDEIVKQMEGKKLFYIENPDIELALRNLRSNNQLTSTSLSDNQSLTNAAPLLLMAPPSAKVVSINSGHGSEADGEAYYQFNGNF
jgi:hypothetical protein